MNMCAATSKVSVKSLYKCEGSEGEFAIKSLCIFLCQVHLPHSNKEKILKMQLLLQFLFPLKVEFVTLSLLKNLSSSS